MDPMTRVNSMDNGTVSGRPARSSMNRRENDSTIHVIRAIFLGISSAWFLMLTVPRAQARIMSAAGGS